MKKQRKPETFIRQPNYPGGKKSLDEFIRQNLRYPQEAMDHKVEGTVSVEFDIDVFGEVSEVRIKHGLGYGCDEEAVRLVKLLKFEKKRYQGLRVTFHKTIHVHFRLSTASLPQQQFAYEYKEKKKAGDPPSYSYTIQTGNE
ncbi:MAG: energy transducer TonB [Bacteroidetes bacterium]|nr:energy transducer TonB [Bacteroidota bacterium]